MAVIDELRSPLAEVLRAHAVQIAAPQEEMVELKAVLAGRCFSKPRTNLLLRRLPDLTHWQFFVDDDFSYQGDDDLRRRLFCGGRVNHWLELTPAEPVEGDVNQALLQALEWLDSPICQRMVAQRAGERGQVAPLDPLLARCGRLLTRADLERLAVEPTASQAEAMRRIAQILTRVAAPACAVVFGPSGCGKTAVVASASLKLLGHPGVRSILQLSGAAIASGAIFPQQRDERLRQVLDLAHARGRTLVLLEQFDLVVRRSETAACLIAEYVDRGLKLTGIARSDYAPRDLAHCDLLARRAEPVVLAEPAAEEQREIVGRRLSEHPLAKRVEVAPEVVPAVLMLARLRPGANPGAALALLDAGLVRAAWSGTSLLGPDDFYDLVPSEPEED